jgi:integrating conjugative element protein (TIGR03765 family)
MRTRPSPAPLLLAWLMMTSAQAAQPTRAPVVVYRGAQSVPTAPYIQAFVQPREKHCTRLESTPKTGVTPLGTRLPLMPRQLRPGLPSAQQTRAPVQPFFIIGMDRTSLDWLSRTLPTLLAINAIGMVVQAASREDWQLLQSKAQGSGLSLALYPDTGLKEAYGITTYPVLVVPQGILEVDTVGEGGP